MGTAATREALRALARRRQQLIGLSGTDKTTLRRPPIRRCAPVLNRRLVC
jgi:hypothetical protein